MKAKHIMTTNVISVLPQATIKEIANVLLTHHLSGVPVIDGSNRLVGMVSEGDLMSRSELGTERPRSWWLGALCRSEDSELKDFIRSHGRCAEDVMTRGVTTVTEDSELADIARLLESQRIKRIPVVRDGAVVGIVSRANLIQQLAVGGAISDQGDDESIRKAIDNLSRSTGWMTHGNLNATVRAGMVEMWGWVESEAERRAIRLAVGEIPGVRDVVDHLGLIAPYLRGA